jgi:hypothetical protein
MAYAAYSEVFAPGQPARGGRQALPAPFAVLAVTVCSLDALRVRRALVDCPGAGIVRCVPQPLGSRVRLEIRLPLARADEVIHRVLDCVPSGEIGRLTPWAGHLAGLGLADGL